MRNMKGDTTIHVRVPAADKREIRRLAKAETRVMSTMVLVLVREAIKARNNGQTADMLQKISKGQA